MEEEQVAAASGLGELLGKDLGTVDASVSSLLWLHEQAMVRFALEITYPLHHPIILANCKDYGFVKI